jgi:hypothetical protein
MESRRERKSGKPQRSAYIQDDEHTDLVGLSHYKTLVQFEENLINKTWINSNFIFNTYFEVMEQGVLELDVQGQCNKKKQIDTK